MHWIWIVRISSNNMADDPDTRVIALYIEEV